ncbi:MAG: class I SAM-dependent methyltransferase [Kiritimatiellia bacterium]|jgi:ubiquinone/menaquinone biosynthesis C-methylase UbiE|nr:class I SAM-dependent methyltransferase [Kiritimatiellia bacterium]MDP6848364.1 class I SAM-dependent methyltransferase [Kiritimatiellia bacterium]
MNRRIWDFWAERYDSLWVQRFSLEPSRREIVRNIHVRPGMDLLDVGCGTGQLFGDLADHFADEPFSYRGIDQSAQMIEMARSKYPAADFVVVPSEEYNAPNETCDVIIFSNSFPYIPDKKAVLVKFRNMLKEGGLLIIVQASINNPYDAIMLSLVKFTTSSARYLSRRRIRAMAEPVFHSQPEETRISQSILMPSIYLFKWARRAVEIRHKTRD